MSATIQHRTFPDGGFVLHKCTDGRWQGRFSAWFDRAGQLLAAEQLLTRGSGIMTQVVSGHVQRNGPAWQWLETVGARYVTAMS